MTNFKVIAVNHETKKVPVLLDLYACVVIYELHGKYYVFGYTTTTC